MIRTMPRMAGCAVVFGFLALGGPASAQDSPAIWERIAQGDLGPDPGMIAIQEALSNGQWAQAEALLLQRVTDSPGDAIAVALYCRALGERLAWSDVLDWTERALQTTDHNTAPLRFYRAWALAMTGREAEAAEELEQAAQFRGDLPDSHVYLANLAELHLVLGRPEIAQSLYQQSLSQAAGYLPALIGYTFALTVQGRVAEADRVVRRALLDGADRSASIPEGAKWLRAGLDGPWHLLAAMYELTPVAELDALEAELRSSEAGALLSDVAWMGIAELRSRPPALREVARVPCALQQISASDTLQRMVGVCPGGGLRVGERQADGTMIWRARALDTPDSSVSTHTPDVHLSADGAEITVLHTPVRVETFAFGATSAEDRSSRTPAADELPATQLECSLSPSATYAVCYTGAAWGPGHTVVDLATLESAMQGQMTHGGGVLHVSDDGRVVAGIEYGSFSMSTGAAATAMPFWRPMSQAGGYLDPVTNQATLTADGQTLVTLWEGQLYAVDVVSGGILDRRALGESATALQARPDGSVLVATSSRVYVWEAEALAAARIP